MSGVSNIISNTKTALGLNRAKNRLFELQDYEESLGELETKEEIVEWGTNVAKQFSDRFGKAGIITPEERKKATLIRNCILVSFTLIGLFFGISKSIPSAIFFTFIGVYFGYVAWLLVLRYYEKIFIRKVLYELPVALESIILLVETGYGILPALEQVITTRTRQGKKDPVSHIFKLVYQLSAHGISFSQSLEIVADAIDLKSLKHVLLHLDVGGAEGGKIAKSLRSLSNHAHKTWKMSVETRVKKLENLVVFPVFVAVMGLMLLTSAVPLVPVMEFMDNAKNQKSSDIKVNK